MHINFPVFCNVAENSPPPIDACIRKYIQICNNSSEIGLFYSKNPMDAILMLNHELKRPEKDCSKPSCFTELLISVAQSNDMYAFQVVNNAEHLRTNKPFLSSFLVNDALINHLQEQVEKRKVLSFCERKSNTYGFVAVLVVGCEDKLKIIFPWGPDEFLCTIYVKNTNLPLYGIIKKCETCDKVELPSETGLEVMIFPESWNPVVKTVPKIHGIEVGQVQRNFISFFQQEENTIMVLQCFVSLTLVITASLLLVVLHKR